MKITTLLFGALASGLSVVSTTNGFILARPAQPLLASSSFPKVSRGGATRLDVATTSTETATATPTWQELQERINPVVTDDDASSPQDEPVLTLYRDTNGWCPFCERVWLCIRVKQLPYRERLVSLQNKPDWYKELVPTTQVPAMLLHPTTNNDSSPRSNSRTIIWESLDIMNALDEAFPDTPRLVFDTPEYQAAIEQTTQLGSAGIRYIYSGRNTSLTVLEVDELKQDFIKALDLLEDSFSSTGGPFRLGSEFSGADATMVPLLERWRYQLPISKDFDILQGRPSLQKWFDAMDSFAPYSERVAGDAYSWAATNSVFTRYFGGDSENEENIKAVVRSDAAADQLVQGFTDISSAEVDARLARQAAEKLITNHEAVIADCTNQDPKSQQHIGRSDDPSAADIVLRHVCSLLLLEDGNAILEAAQTRPMVEISDNQDRLGASQAARTVATRLSVPRDMGAPSAKILRAVLSIVADRLEAETKTTQV
jgi:glutathione S-transferase